MDHRVREESLDRPVRKLTGLDLRDVRELEVVDASRRHMAHGRDSEQPQRLLDALRLRVQDSGLEFDPNLDADGRCVRDGDPPPARIEPER